jgi:hypothetical protein
VVEKWAETAEHPQTHKRFVEMVYPPMIELLDFLRYNHFKTFIVSGGGIDFVRQAPSGVYGIPPEQMIGSSKNTNILMEPTQEIRPSLESQN